MNDGTVQERWCQVYEDPTLVMYLCAWFQLPFYTPSGATKPTQVNGTFVRSSDLPYLTALFSAMPFLRFDTTQVPPCGLEEQSALASMRMLGAPPERWAAEAAAFFLERQK